jgi:hypothetical protein
VSILSNLLELNQALMIVAGVGFVSGVTYGVVDSFLELLIIKKREISFGTSAKKCVLLGFAMAIIYPLFAFAFISVSSVSVEAITRDFIIVAIASALVGPTTGKLYDFAFSDRSPR